MSWCVKILVFHSSIALYDRAAGVYPTTTTTSKCTTTSRQQTCKDWFDFYTCEAQLGREPQPKDLWDDILCEQLFCAANEKKCCRPICEDMTCPSGWVQNPANSHKGCESNAGCGQVDTNVCCLPTCMEMKCPTGWIQNPSNAKRPCQSSNGCTEVDKKVCCLPTCLGDMTCPSGWVQNPANSHKECESSAGCSQVDTKTCCLPTCREMKCPTGWYQNKSNTDRPCQSSFGCTEVDKNVCCVPTCLGDMTCPSGWVQNPANSHKECQSSAGCSQVDTKVCCLPTCIEMKCPTGWFQNPSSANRPCQSGFGCTEVDKHVCCQHTCGDFDCGVNFTQREDSAHACSAGKPCTRQECCSATCRLHSCPQYYASRGQSLLCHDRYNCNDVKDRDNCCQLTCAGHTCGAYQHRKPPQTLCLSGSQCTSAECCRETCGGFDCQPSFILKSNSDDIVCSDTHFQCAPSDNAKCCDRTCLSYTCAPTYSKKVALQEIRCNDTASCTLSECCKATCAGYQGCVGTWRARLNSATIDCINPASCTDADREACCVRTCQDFTCPLNFWKEAAVACRGTQACDREECCHATCQGYTCPPHWKNKEKGLTIPCAAAGQCTESDRETCCELTCQSFSCPAFHTANSVAITCTNPAGCTKAECCRANCDGVQCPVAWQKRANASDIMCSSPTNCTQNDLRKCCYPTCETLVCPANFLSRGPQQCQLDYTNACRQEECCEAVCAGLLCPDSFTRRVGTSLMKCQDPLQCTIGQDRDTCCQRTCENHQCHATFSKEHGKLQCRDNNRCLDSECCRANCLNLTCPHAWIQKPTSETTWCAGKLGCTLGDRNTCCQLTCASFACLGTYTPKIGDPVQRICQDPGGCTRSECCQATCLNYTCPSLPHMWTRRAAPYSIMCNDSDACSAADREACCKLTCKSFECPPGFWHNSGDVECSNKDGGCNISECCHATCSGYDCPTNWKLKLNADSIMCSSSAGCVDEDHMNCCRLTCASYTCDLHHSPNEASIECADNKGCTKSECCRANCAGYNCTAGWQRRPMASAFMCKSSSGCTMVDQPMCCRPTCDTFTCPPQYASVGRRTCAQFPCSQSECCHRTCSNYSCPSSSQLKPNASHINCSVTNGCLAEKCCQSLCSSFKCPSTHRQRLNASSIVCPHSYGTLGCNPSDISSCCEAPCTSFFCTGKWHKRHNAAELFCPGPSGCTSNDFARCCLVPITCANYTCPPTMLKKPFAQNILCHDMQVCTDIDTDTCCNPIVTTTPPLVTCYSYTCPIPWKKKANTDAVACKMATGCTDDDLQTCCYEPDPPCGTVAPKVPGATEPLQDNPEPTAEQLGKLLAGGVAAVSAVNELLAPTTTQEPVPKENMYVPPQPLTGAQTTGTPAKTSLSVAHTKGASELEVASTIGFEIGQDVIIDPGTSIAEANKIIAFASLVLQSPLLHDHDAGAVVMRITTRARKQSEDATEGSSGSSSDVFGSSSGDTTSPALIISLSALVAISVLAMLVAGIIYFCSKKGKIGKDTRHPEFNRASREDAETGVHHSLLHNQSPGHDRPMTSVIPPDPSHELKIGLHTRTVDESSNKSRDSRNHHTQPLEATPMSSPSSIPVMGLTPPAGLSYASLHHVGALTPTPLDLSRSGMNYIDVGSPFHSPLDVTQPSMNYASAGGYGFHGDGIAQSPSQVPLDFGTMALAPELFPETGNLISPVAGMHFPGPGYPGQDYSEMDYGQPSYANPLGLFPNSGYVGVASDVRYN